MPEGLPILNGVLSKDQIRLFQRDLLAWFDGHRRNLPWRRTRDPYAIWISEVMLQQTRVAAAIPYFERFLARFPNFQLLADALESEVLTYWAGLGYYYRARNLQKAAQLMKQCRAFPETHDEIRALPGVGDYTAAAIASIAFDLPHAAVDGNVLRVLTRVYDDSADIASVRGRKHVAELAGALLDRSRPGDFNQAVIELGATVCLPRNPQCLVCPVSGLCQARMRGSQDLRPIKLRTTTSVEEERVVFWIEEAGRLLVWQRPESSRLMPGFWELPERSELPAAAVGESFGSFRHGITFRNYRFEVRQAQAQGELGMCRWVQIEALTGLPLSTVLKKATRVVIKAEKARGTPRSSAASR
jgi:A/G-specific adenine glycosylase